MNSLIVYGSLLNKHELGRQGFKLGDVNPVIISGFKRVFNQEPSWRTGVAQERAVLSVVKSDSYWLNGILISNLPESLILKLDERERGYDRIEIGSIHVRMYKDTKGLTTAGKIYMYIGRPEKQNPVILPNSSYLNICLEGAKQWGQDFYQDFLDTTYLNKNVRLKEVIKTTSSSTDYT